jgi:LysR family transcriptional regulator, nitrogen assimilation regulatory protein
MAEAAVELLRLRVFIHVAEHRSITRTAHLLNTTQSAISRQISALEADLGGRLFHRTGRGVALTDLGRSVEPRIRGVLVELDRIASEAKTAAGIASGDVHVGMLATMAPRISPELLRRVQLRHPKVRLHLADGSSEQLEEQLFGGRLDMAILFRYGSDERDEDEPLGVLQSYLVGTAGDPLTAAPTIQFRQLDGVHLAVPAAPNGIRRMLEDLARQHDIELKVAAEVGSVTIQLALVADSLEPIRVVGSYYAVADAIASGRMQASQIVSPAIERKLVLTTHRRRPSSTAVREVSRIVAELARELLADAEHISPIAQV